MTTAPRPSSLMDRDLFVHRHVGPRPAEVAEMLAALGHGSLDGFIDAVVPESIRMTAPLALPRGRTESDVLAELREIASRNHVFRSYIGMGYHDCHTPPVILRNVLENPGWYTAYTPYQAEIAQGRLEALLNFQTMVSDLTGLPIANASLLDEGTAAAEAMAMAHALAGTAGASVFFVADSCHPQTIEVVRTRARARGFTVVVGDPAEFEFGSHGVRRAAAVSGHRRRGRRLPRAGGTCARGGRAGDGGGRPAGARRCSRRRASGAPTSRSAARSGSACRWATAGRTRRSSPRATSTSASMPGRIIGVSRDAEGRPALRMALQTREQHIRREKATSNVCTAQVLLAVMAGMYAVWHGPDGLTRIARRVHALTATLAAGLERLGYTVQHDHFFDTLRVGLGEREAATVLGAARVLGINLRGIDEHTVGVSLDETTTVADLTDVLSAFNRGQEPSFPVAELLAEVEPSIPAGAAPKHALPRAPGVQHAPLRDGDAALHAHAAVARPLARAFDDPARLVHDEAQRHGGDDPGDVAGVRQAASVRAAGSGRGLPAAVRRAGARAGEITGFAGVSLQPNAGSQGEYAGLLVIRATTRARGEGHRDRVPDPAVGARHQPGQRGDGGHEGGGGEDRCERQHRRRRPAREGRAALGQPGGADGDVSVHARRVRGAIREICAIVHEHGGAGVHGRREHERAGRAWRVRATSAPTCAT